MLFSDLNPHNFPTTVDISANLVILALRMDSLRDVMTSQYPDETASFFYNGEFKITSGLRNQAAQQVLIAQGKSHATKSNHLIGAAVDIYDPNGTLDEWCDRRVAVIIDIGLWMENKAYTPGWAHFQIFPPKSGNRFFIP
jgi:hypothetical protein